MWVIISELTRIFIDADEPRIVATLADDFDAALDAASQWHGQQIHTGAWHRLDDSRTALRAAVEASWGALDWSGDWYVAGVVS